MTGSRWGEGPPKTTQTPKTWCSESLQSRCTCSTLQSPKTHHSHHESRAQLSLPEQTCFTIEKEQYIKVALQNLITYALLTNCIQIDFKANIGWTGKPEEDSCLHNSAPLNESHGVICIRWGHWVDSTHTNIETDLLNSKSKTNT